jgi:hypothetical protein
MTDRMRKFTKKKQHSIALTNAVTVYPNEPAFLDTSTGKATVGGASTTLLPIGVFTKAQTGDGTTKALIDLYEEITLEWFDNDGVSPVAADDIGSECYVKDTTAVSMSSGGSTRSIAGRVWDVSTLDGVAVQAGTAVTGPTGASGFGLAAGSVADKAALKAIAAADRFDGELVMVRADGSLWRFAATSVLTDDEADELVQEPDAGTGAWLRADKAAIIKLPVAASMADHATILTVPAGFVMRLIGLPFWDITTTFDGGTVPRIGIATDITGYDTAGDILGGAAGEVTGALVGGTIVPGTIGPKLDTPAEMQALVLQAGDLVTYEEITSAYTGGAGFVCFPVAIIAPAA